MSRLTLDGLRSILLECAGADESVDLDRDILDMEFADLGYDSLAVLETVSLIQRRHGAALQDDVVLEARTPRDLIDLTNKALAESR
ncbi:acyl carrier protein [Streptomyces sp. NPDC051172]|uniref:acyl carrier protein n=1 Tax=Streptomyces sp. NPDC051172 TaxID=3155796 RepID=UPI00342918EE